MNTLSESQLTFLAKLPLLLNSSLKVENVVQGALTHLEKMCDATASTLYLLDGKKKFLRFWVSRGDHAEELKDKKIPRNHGMVGWVIEHKLPLLVNDVQNDSRFVGEAVVKGDFQTQNSLCVPLIAKGERIIGAVQVLNSRDPSGFQEPSLVFLEQCAHQISLALENAFLYERTKKQSEQLLAIEKRKTEMLTLLAHEFRTPLNVIQTSSEVLGGQGGDQALREQLVEALQSGVSRLLRLVSQIRNLSLAESRDYPLHSERCNMVQIVKSLTERLSPDQTKRELRIQLRTTETETFVQGDRALLTLALYNLLANAIRFTPDGGKIDVAVTSDKERAWVSVSDTGIGIAEDQLELIFTRFYEVTDILQHSSGTFTFKSSGLGLGLPTSKSIIERHGGTLSVEIEKDRGTTFTMELPTGEV